MMLRDFFRLLHIHPLLICYLFVSLISGTFLQIFILLLIVLIHEWGHYVAARIFGWEIRAIILWIFGGVMQTNLSYTRSLKEEMLVTLSGPIQHLVIFIGLLFLDTFALLPKHYMLTAYEYNLLLFLFNLVPLYPLDGGKLLLLCFYRFFPFYQSHRFIILFSISLTALLFVLMLKISLPLTLALILAFIVYENIVEWKKIPYLFFRFLNERLRTTEINKPLKRIIVQRNERIYDICKRFYRTYQHVIFVLPAHLLMERTLLTYYFYQQNVHANIAEIIKEKR